MKINFKNLENKKRQSGNVLLLALLVMASIMTAALGIGAIILNEIKQASNVDFSTVAYYAAESGVEQALYKLRKEDAVLACSGGTCVNGFCSGGDHESCIQGAGNLSNQSSWQRTVTDKEWQVYGTINKDDSMQVDLYDPDGNTAAGIESVKIEWTPDCILPATSSIEVSYVGWDAAMGWSTSSEQKFQYSALASPVIVNGLSSGKSYRLRIKSLYCNADNVIVTAWGGDNAANPQIQIPARIVLSSVGLYGSLEQAIQMNMPRKSPMSGLYDYVLFSQCSLVKGDTSTCP